MSRRLALAVRTGFLVADETDGRWTTTTVATDARPECVHLDSRRPDRVLIGTYGDGLFVSVDGGDTFEQAGAAAIADAAVTALASHPTDPDRLIAGTEPSRLYHSRDGGTTWSPLPAIDGVASATEWSFPPRPHTHHVRWVEIDPADPDRWYVGIEAGALLVTPDAGETWIDRPPGSRRDNHTLATHPGAPGRVYSAAGDGYAESADWGETWEERHDGLDHRYVWGLAVDPGDPNTVVVSAATGASGAHRTPGDAYLYRRADETGWRRLDDADVPTGPGRRRAVLASGLEAGELFAATDDGVYRSGDGGQRWARLDLEPPEPLAGAIPRGLAAADIG